MKNLKKLSVATLSVAMVSSCLANCFGSTIESELNLVDFNGGEISTNKENMTESRKNYKINPEIIKKINNLGYILESESPIGNGSYSIVFAIKDLEDNKYVLKIPKRSEEEDRSRWFKEKQEVYNTLKEFNACLTDYNGNIKIPQICEINEDYVIEEYAGDSLCNMPYQDLTPDEKEYIISNLAKFFSYVINRGNSKKISEYESVYTKFSDENIFERLLKNSDYYEKFFGRDKQDEIETWVFPDIHLGNITYDRDTKTIMIIDIDGLKKGCVYTNFLSLAVCDDSQTGLKDFIENLLKKINSCSEVQLSIDKWKFLNEIESSDDVVGEVWY